MNIDRDLPEPQLSGKTRKSVMEVVNSKEATALYRTSSFLLLALISTCAYVATGALGDLKDLTVEVRRLNDRPAKFA